jgi:TolB-like protein
VTTVYAGAAFVILELTDIIAEPLKLPAWFLPAVIVMLSIGLILTIILSWIYDFHPEGGMVKTVPAEKIKADEAAQGELTASSRSWKIATYISLVVIAGLILLNVIPRLGSEEILEKSIAVLPFESLSDDPEKQYQADGVMDAILLHLSKIEDLRVISRTSVEQYRVTTKTVPEICEELDVAYVLEGSFRRYGDQARLIVQLIQSGRESHVWANQYDRDWGDIFKVESEVAQYVARELQAVIAPEVRERIEKVPTSDLTAYDYYLRGLNEYSKYSLFNPDMELLQSAQALFNRALDFDSTLAPAYAGLARVHMDLNRFGESYLSADFMDTVLILADKALSFDPQLSEAYSIKGDYYIEVDRDLALSSYDRALELNPNDWSVYWGKAKMFYNDDLLITIKNIHLAMSRYHGPLLSEMLYLLGYQYYTAGFLNKGDSIFMELSRVVGDTTMNMGPAFRESILCNRKGELAIYEKSGIQDGWYFEVGRAYAETGQYEEAVRYMEKQLEMLETSGMIVSNGMHRIGYAYWMAGDKEKGTYYMNLQKEYCEDAIRHERRWARNLYYNYDLAGVYAFLGERDKAYENLRIYNQRDRMTLQFASLIKQDPLFNNIREEPEFQQIVREVEAKYQAEHQRVSQWLEENDML